MIIDRSVLDTERFLIQSYQLNKVHIVHWVRGGQKNFFGVIDSKMALGERFSFLMGIYGNFNGEMARF